MESSSEDNISNNSSKSENSDDFSDLLVTGEWYTKYDRTTTPKGTEVIRKQRLLGGAPLLKSKIVVFCNLSVQYYFNIIIQKFQF